MCCILCICYDIRLPFSCLVYVVGKMLKFVLILHKICGYLLWAKLWSLSLSCYLPLLTPQRTLFIYYYFATFRKPKIYLLSYIFLPLLILHLKLYKCIDLQCIFYFIFLVKVIWNYNTKAYILFVKHEDIIEVFL